MKTLSLIFPILLFAIVLLPGCSETKSELSNNWISEDGNIKIQFTQADDDATDTYTLEFSEDGQPVSAESGSYTLNEDETLITTVNEMEIESTYEVVKLAGDQLVLKGDRLESYGGEVTFNLDKGE